MSGSTLLRLGRPGALMNSFHEHHKGSIRWHYRCFDRILLNGLARSAAPRSTRSWTGNGWLTSARTLATLDRGPVSFTGLGTLLLEDVQEEPEMCEIEVAGLVGDEPVSQRHDRMAA